mgnify:CR=1 FL=1
MDKAGYKLLPKNNAGGIDKNLGLYAAIYSLLIIPTVLWAYVSGNIVLSPLSLGLVILVTVVYTALGLRLQISPSRKSALQLMLSSFFYLPLVLFIFLIG